MSQYRPMPGKPGEMLPGDFYLAANCGACGGYMHSGESSGDICALGEMICMNSGCRNYGKTFRAPRYSSPVLADYSKELGG